ncbi:Aste57867_485 [Aphanomyces stellatus]|uniref:Aste57867_485 protein n=1 Tax=Aphanomyces stellatus TaxID=120398 RepID=A0A485K2X2_9STRA|nr:hypothetical protein As57867_000484 [Aphanomyces stellatus]VFT77710.1 Aste57867_485 [Aphanomyces stellatus]
MDRSTLVFLAKLAEQAERYHDMVDHMKTVAIDYDQELSTEENNLLVVAYKNEVGPRRAAWRVLHSIQTHVSESDDHRLKTIQLYRHKIESEIADLCDDVLVTIDKHLLPKATTSDAQAYYHKMKGDYYRYWAEIQTGDAHTHTAKLARTSYDQASQLMAKLAPTHPLRLGHALNYAVFLYEIENSHDRAVTVAKEAFDAAIAELDSLSEDSYRDTTLIMQLLRDNVTLWMSLTKD